MDRRLSAGQLREWMDVGHWPHHGRRWSTSDLALCLGVSPDHVSRWRTGKRRPPPYLRAALRRLDLLTDGGGQLEDALDASRKRRLICGPPPPLSGEDVAAFRYGYGYGVTSGGVRLHPAIGRRAPVRETTRALGVGERTLDEWCSGRVRPPLAVALALAYYLGLTRDGWWRNVQHWGALSIDPRRSLEPPAGGL